MSKDRNAGPFEQVGEMIGGTVGKMAGRANDMAMNAFGTVFGSVLQQMGEWWSSPDAQRAWSALGERDDRAFREHYQSRRGGTATPSGAAPSGTSTSGAASQASADPGYERARTAYRFGHVASQNPEYRAKPFDQVEADLEKAWQAAAREEHGDWTEVRDHVSYGYTYRMEGAPNPS